MRILTFMGCGKGLNLLAAYLAGERRPFRFAGENTQIGRCGG
jgi:hypothetical protein